MDDTTAQTIEEQEYGFSRRANVAAGFRRIADLLEADHGVPLPMEADYSHLTVFVDTGEEFAAFARTFGGRLVENWYGSEPAIVAKLDGVEIVARPTARAQLGERYEIGTAPVYEYQLPADVEALRDPEEVTA